MVIDTPTQASGLEAEIVASKQSRESKLDAIQHLLAEQIWLASAYQQLESMILELFDAERLSIFQRRRHHQDLVAHLKTGNDIREIQVPISSQSIAGYVALSQLPVIINDAYDQVELAAIHSRLKFDQHFDQQAGFRTKSIICVPIMNAGVVLGVMEIINKSQGTFSDGELHTAMQLATLLGEKYRYEIGGTVEPFDYLVHRGRLSERELSTLKATTNDPAEILKTIQSKYNVPDTELGNALSVHYQVPFIAYSPDEYHTSILQSHLNESYLECNHVAVIADASEVPILLMAEPNNASLLVEIEAALGHRHCEIAVSLPSHITKYLKQVPEDEPSENFESLISEVNAEEEGQAPDGEAGQELVTEDTPAVVRLVDKILQDAYNQGASDIHIDPEKDSPTLIRFRVDGECSDVTSVSRLQHNAIVARIKILSNLNIAEKRLPQDGKLTFRARGKKVEVRVATVPTVTGEGVVLRILASSGAMPMAKLNLAPTVDKRLRGIMGKPHGIFLVVGPTGSGKTTTLHSILGELNRPRTKIWTAEDPVEITQHRLQQVQINSKIGFTFERALRAFLRADPDIILIGEMRDRETAHAAIEASLTGHLVLSTLHTNSAPETITRLLEMGLDPINFSDACLGILAQRLMRTLCKKCKQAELLTAEDKAFILEHYGETYINELDLSETASLYHAVGCQACNGTGYKGRTGVHELLTMTPDLSRLVNKEAPLQQMSDQAVKDGLRTLLQDSLLKLLKGDTDIKQVRMLHGLTG